MHWLTRLALCILCALALPAAPAPTSPLRFQHLEAFGSDEFSVLSILQDRQGFIWIGTHASGLYRYNGYRAVRYVSNPRQPRSLPSDRVSALFEDKQGHIWAGTQDGLARFDPETNDFTRMVPAQGPPNRAIVKSIVSDGKDGMWLATWGGVQHFDPAHGTFVQYVHDPARSASLGAEDINALVVDKAGGLWAATWPGGLDYLPPGGQEFRHYRVDDPAHPDPMVNIVRALQIDASGALWIGTEKSVVVRPAGADWSARATLATGTTRVNAFYLDRNGSMWAGTLDNGLLRWDRSGGAPVHYLHRASDPHSLAGDHVRVITQDRGGMLWVGTFTEGISVANLNSHGFGRLIPYDEDTATRMPTNAIQNMDAASGGRLWIGGVTGFSLFDPASGQAERIYRADPHKPGALASDIIYSLYQQPGGPLWVGTAAGLHRLDAPDQPFRVVHLGPVAADFVNTVVPGADGRLWIGTSERVVHYDPRSDAHEDFLHDPAQPDSRSVNGTTTIVEDKLGRVWMGSEWNGGGLDMLDPRSGKFRHFHHVAGDPASLADDYVVTLYRDAQDRIWIGTAEGLNQVIEGTNGGISFRTFAFADAVGHDKVLAMRSDAAGQLWVATNNNLLRLDPASGKVMRYWATDGITDGFVVGSATAGPDGKLYFGGLKGITVVDPPHVQTVSTPPAVAITDISIFNRSLKEGKPEEDVKLSGPVTAPTALLLSVQESVFSIEFAALHYTNPRKNRYMYRLIGFDRDWVETDADHRSATYTNLNPGNYTFEVKAANDRGVWGNDVARLAITILPPFWQTLWFRMLAGALAAGALIALYHRRVQRLTRQQQQLAALVAERTRELEESNAKLAELSTTDALTGIMNRRGFDAALAGEWRRAKRNHQSLAFALLDVDHFKKYNDHYGHPAGDVALRSVAQVVASHGRRTSDVAARYGGEEFALLLPSTDAAHALQVARGVCEDLQRLALPHEESPYGVVTASIGVAVLTPGEGNTPEMLIHNADLALYRAKQEGRNRAVLAAF